MEGTEGPVSMTRISVLDLPLPGRSIDSSTSIVSRINKLLANGSYTSIVDFDEHLDAVDADWTNIAINNMLEPSGGLMEH